MTFTSGTLAVLFLLLCSVTNASGQTGRLTLFANVDSFYVVDDGNYQAAVKIASGDEVAVPGGSRWFRFASASSDDVVMMLNVPEDSVVTLYLGFTPSRNLEQYLRRSSYPRLEWDANLFVFSDPESDVYIQRPKQARDWVGRGIGRIALPEGEYVVEVRHAQAGRVREQVEIKADSLAILELYARPDQATARWAMLVPGLNQAFKNEWGKAGTLVGGFAAGVALSLYGHLRYGSYEADYHRAVEGYGKSVREADALRLAEEMEHFYAEVGEASRLRTAGLLLTAAVYLYNVLDARRAPRSGYREAYDDVNREIAPYFNEQGVGLRISFRF